MNFVRNDDEMMHQQLEKMFRSDINDDIFSVESHGVSVRPKSLGANGELCKSRERSLSAVVTMVTQVSEFSKQPRIRIKETISPEEAVLFKCFTG